MRITVLCTDIEHPVRPLLLEWKKCRRSEHDISIVEDVEEVENGDFLFLIACHQIVSADVRDNFRHTLVVHSSDLPKGRGWSPHVWTIIEGSNEIVVTLLEAADRIDEGAIWKKVTIDLEGHELQDEINAKLFKSWIELIDYALDHEATVKPIDQSAGNATYYRRRVPDDSRLDPDRTIRDQFNLLRVADPNRYPAFFEINGSVYDIVVKKRNKQKGAAL